MNIALKRKSNQKISKESQFIGYIVLGFGALAVISVMLVAANRFGGKNTNSPMVQNVTTTEQVVQTPPTPVSKPVPINNPELQNRVAQDLIKNLPQNFSSAPVQTKKPNKQELYFNRQPDLKISDIEGSWQSMVGDSTIVLTLTRGSYQMIVANPNEYSERKYSSGNFTMIEDILVFSPRHDWPKPTPPRGTDVKYTPITMAKFPVIAAMRGGKMLWQNPPSTENRVYVPRALAILTDPKQGFLVWQRTK